MENYRRALNYETVVRVLQKADTYCWSVFSRIADECDVREELPFNLDVYAHILEVDSSTLNDAYIKCRSAFEHLDERTVILAPENPMWPPEVRNIPFLYLLGNTGLLNTKGISVVGTRNPSDRGMQLDREVVDSLGESGFTVFSGLAMGIDGVAHIECLAKDFSTVGVIGTSLCEAYPKKHERLQSLVAQNGLLVSQFAPSRKTQQYFFMQRNLLMSQLSRGSLVVEDRDGGGGVKQALYSERQGKKVFILREVYDNRTYLWPRKFRDPVILTSTHTAGANVKRAIRMTSAFGTKKTEDLQPTLF